LVTTFIDPAGIFNDYFSNFEILGCSKVLRMASAAWLRSFIVASVSIAVIPVILTILVFMIPHISQITCIFYEIYPRTSNSFLLSYLLLMKFLHLQVSII
jgi:hypothetical protein